MYWFFYLFMSLSVGSTSSDPLEDFLTYYEEQSATDVNDGMYSADLQISTRYWDDYFTEPVKQQLSLQGIEGASFTKSDLVWYYTSPEGMIMVNHGDRMIFQWSKENMPELESEALDVDRSAQMRTLLSQCEVRRAKQSGDGKIRLSLKAGEEVRTSMQLEGVEITYHPDDISSYRIRMDYIATHQMRYVIYEYQNISRTNTTEDFPSIDEIIHTSSGKLKAEFEGYQIKNINE